MALEMRRAALLDEFKRRGVHAVAEPGRFRTVVENMPEMGVTTGAEDLGEKN